MTTKYTILESKEVTPILQWLANHDKYEVAKILECSARTLERHLSQNKFKTERLEKLKTLMNP